MTIGSEKPENARFPYLKSLQISWKEGAAASCMQAVIDYYLIPLAVFLGAVPAQIGLLVAIPNLIGALTQLFSVELVMLAGSHLKFLVWGSVIQGLLLLPICALPLLSNQPHLEMLILLITLFRILASIIQTVWAAQVSHYLPAEERGKYFGWRSQISCFFTIFSVALSGAILYLGGPQHFGVTYAIVFALAAAARLLSAFLMSKMQSVEITTHREEDFTFWMFLVRIRESNFVKFAFFVAGLVFATNLAAPFFSVYMFRELHLSYLQYLVMQSLLIMMTLIGFPFWGNWADRVGNVKVLQTTGLIILFIPVLWLTSRNFFFLCSFEMLSGFVWAGFNLSTVNFIYDAVSPGKRTRCLSYFYLINGSAIFLGASLGGLAADHLPKLLGSKILCLFLISAIARAFFYALLSKKFREVRSSAEPASNLDLFFSVIRLPFQPFLGESAEGSSLFSKPDWLKKDRLGK